MCLCLGYHVSLSLGIHKVNTSKDQALENNLFSLQYTFSFIFYCEFICTGSVWNILYLHLHINVMNTFRIIQHKSKFKREHNLNFFCFCFCFQIVEIVAVLGKSSEKIFSCHCKYYIDKEIYTLVRSAIHQVLKYIFYLNSSDDLNMVRIQELEVSLTCFQCMS